MSALVTAFVFPMLAFTAGCTDNSDGGPPFLANLVNARFQEGETGEDITDEHRQEIANILMATFGTPDDPDTPFDVASKSFLTRAGFNVDQLKLAAGAVSSSQDGQVRGLYRKHCVHCHGISGDGRGPTAAFLNPYPRDYRHGRFKFKSTFGATKPTRDDLKRILMQGVPGSSMPSFRLLPDNDLEALIEYVKYLSVRGEAEIRLIEAYAAEGDFGGMESLDELVELFAGGLPLEIDEGEAEEPEYENTVASLMYGWFSAKDEVIQNAEIPDFANSEHEDYDREKTITLGRDLFYGKAANCFSCHGDSAQGDGQASDFNYRFEWRKKLTGAPQEEIDESVVDFRHDGALYPRNARPRNLRQGIFRGGRRPIDIYYRIYSGINGTPMPGLASGPDGTAAVDAAADAAGDAEPGVKKVTPTEIWHLVNYVKSLQYEPLSRPVKAPVVLSPQDVESNVGR